MCACHDLHESRTKGYKSQTRTSSYEPSKLIKSRTKRGRLLHVCCSFSFDARNLALCIIGRKENAVSNGRKSIRRIEA